jgi:FAD-dependent halogenase
MSAHDGSAVDVVVVGGGPGGSTVATFIAMQGYKVLLLEKQRQPIYKIGESLLPATVHGICPMLGVTKALKEANFMTKLGGTFRWGKNPEPWTFLFAASPKMAGPTSTAYQVERMKFDSILIQNARAKGVDVREGQCALGPILEDKRVIGLNFTDENGAPRACRSRYVVDASGYQTVLARHVGERVYSKYFKNIALFGYYQGGKRLPHPQQGNIFCVAFEHGWFWYIPLTEKLTSVGAVISKRFASQLMRGYGTVMNELIAACPPIQELLSNAWRVSEGPYGELRVRVDYSYCNNRFWAPGLVVVGDAACFIDPVFSSGVHLATYSALLAARSINTCLRNELSEERSFSEFEARYRREYSHFHDFLLAFYDVDQSIDSYFWQARKVLNSPDADNQAFINLVGGIGGSGEPLYSDPEQFLQSREGLGTVLFPEAGGSSSLIGCAPTRRTEFYKNLLGEIVQVQLQASLKDHRPAEIPLFPGGLVPSRDGLSWAEPRMEQARTSQSMP